MKVATTKKRKKSEQIIQILKNEQLQAEIHPMIKIIGTLLFYDYAIDKNKLTSTLTTDIHILNIINDANIYIFHNLYIKRYKFS